MAGVMNITSRLYPKMLKDTPHPPRTLYFKGNFYPEIFDHCVAVVGSRKMSFYGQKVIEKIFSVLSKKITIVSGFMTGVDAEAHSQALRFGLKTIAVMPCGINRVHPEGQEDLYKKILKENLIMSEYDGNFEPKIWTYPRRNRIVAGISSVVLVIEASENSGSLITARLANSYGRKVCVIPGSIFSNLSSGKIQISNEFAYSIDSGCYINEYLGLENYNEVVTEAGDGGTNSILDVLRNEPMTVDELSKFMSKQVSDISIELTSLSLRGLVQESGGRFHAC